MNFNKINNVFDHIKFIVKAEIRMRLVTSHIIIISSDQVTNQDTSRRGDSTLKTPVRDGPLKLSNVEHG
jgi:hypothetical protein